jgi:hypothetical protein
MGISDPRESTERTDYHRYVCDDSHDQDGVVVDVMVTEVMDDFEHEPQNT